MEKTFTIKGKDGGRKSITCHICNMTSWHPEDIAQRYCGMCKEFHDILALKHRNSVLTAGHVVEDMTIAVPAKQKGREFFKIVFSLMVASLIFSFNLMVQNNTGIVKKFGVTNAAIISVGTFILGITIGLISYKWAKNRKLIKGR